MLRPFLRRRVIVLLLAALCLPGLGVADQVVLKNGNVLEGRAERRPNGDVVVRSEIGELVLPAGVVAKVDRGVTNEETLRRELGAARTASEILAVARRCHALGLESLARRAYERLLVLEPEHDEARRRLGYRRQDDGWTLTPDLPRVQPPRASAGAEDRLVRALLAPTVAPVAAPSPPALVVVSPLAWPPPPGLVTGPNPSTGAPPPVATPPTVTPPAPSPPRARRATRGRFVRTN